MRGFTIIELLLAIVFVTPLVTGAMMGSREGALGALIGLLVGLVIAILWAVVFISWLRRNEERIKVSRARDGTLGLAFLLSLIALQAMAGIITHQLTAPFHH